MKKFYRSREHNVLGGVAGGLAEYFDVDPILTRLALLAALASGLTVVAYIIAWIVVPLTPQAQQ